MILIRIPIRTANEGTIRRNEGTRERMDRKKMVAIGNVFNLENNLRKFRMV